ncbi:hypothetical protein BJY04DRAFT_106771 [Aspergillus karnatakaensis]|uniref:uncharacterized protein n=1 Tax=Aspergillus karnatakaensis TaxID=1810916 RepID=UPI003CCDAB94
MPSKEARIGLDTDISSPTASESSSGLFKITFSQGRPDLRAEIGCTVRDGASSVGIVVCGPSSMSHDVSAAAADAQELIIGGKITAKDVFLHQESFTY